MCLQVQVQPLDDLVDFDDDNALCQITFCEVFICQEGSLIKMFFVRSIYYLLKKILSHSMMRN